VDRKTLQVIDDSTGAGADEPGLPDGYVIAELGGKGGGPLYAVYADGRRVASGMTNPQSALRWARLLAGARMSSVA
jgi:hypothetical protein